ncbi:Endo alpha-1,4 polygalactosaminidase OS=Streptomyces tendae OX=1932 GN=GUR47_11580 PE=4 SV=1 [Streptomyces tendae]
MRRPVLSTALLLLLLAGCTSAPGDDGGDGEGAGRWRPTPGTTWQWQLSGKLDTSVDVPVYDIDGFDHGKATVAGLHEDGRKVICYVSTGAWEDFRPDADEFPAEVLGKGNGWEGERWLDIRATDVLEPLMAERLDMCREKGFDAVEPDNMDGYKNETGFPLTGDDQLRYNRLIAKLAHDRGMAVGLKNDLDQIPELVDDFDFAVNEQCAQYGGNRRQPAVHRRRQGRLPRRVRAADGTLLRRLRELRLSSMLKKYELDAWREPC